MEKAFHQISIEKSDRDMLRFLWFKDTGSTTDIVHYRFCRLPFGLRSSPAILNSVIQKHLSQYRSSYPHVSKLLADSFYVDDFIGGAASSQEGEEVFNVSRRIMSEGGFNLRKWRTNVLDLQKTISPELDSKVSSHVKVLGLGWNTDSDQLYFDLGEVIKYSCNLPPTKRSLLRLSTKIFDPLGFLSPFVIQLKLLFQQLCVDKINWDYPLEGLALSEWKKLLNELEAPSEIHIQRYYLNPNKKIVTSQLHGFCDASTRAYTAVIYLRCFYSDGVVDVNLVTSKTRVAPIKGQTVPRLELLGAVILARLMYSVYDALQFLLGDVRMFYWTDSYTTLCWIRNQKPWKQYVLQRVTEIRRLSCSGNWKFCPGEANPADLPSRGCNSRSLLNNNWWWKGPPFLIESLENWPDLPTSMDTHEANRELAKAPPIVIHSLVSTSQTIQIPDISAIMELTRYSSFSKLLRVTALVLRFISMCKKTHNHFNKELTATDIATAEELWVKSIQRNTFISEIQSLNKTGSMTPLQQQLNLFLDTAGVIRCQGRINNATIPNNSKIPILLPSHSHFTRLLILQRHSQVLHNGIGETLNAVRETHWIVRGRATVKKVRCYVSV